MLHVLLTVVLAVWDIHRRQCMRYVALAVPLNAHANGLQMQFWIVALDWPYLK